MLKRSKENCSMGSIFAYKEGLYDLTENRQLSEPNSKPAFIPVHRTGFAGCLSKGLLILSIFFLFAFLAAILSQEKSPMFTTSEFQQYIVYMRAPD